MADTREQFSPLTIAFHWVIALTIICLLAIGLYMTDLPEGEWRSELYGYHKLAGTTVFLIAAFRILWRWRNGMPVPAADTPAWRHRLAVAAHYCLLIATVAMPLSGAALSYGKGYPIPVLGLFNIGPPVQKIPWLGDAGSFIHYWAGWALIGIIALHVIGALTHHFIDRDHTLRRMLGRRI